MSWTTTGSRGRTAPTARMEMDRLLDQFDERLSLLNVLARKKDFFSSRGVREDPVGGCATLPSPRGAESPMIAEAFASSTEGPLERHRPVPFDAA